MPVAMGRHLAEQVPTAEASFSEGLGHISVVGENEDGFLAALTVESGRLWPTRA